MPRTIADETIEDVLRLTLDQTPRDATHWSTRRMGARVGLSQTTVMRIWHAFGLQPHRTETFKLSKDPLFIEKVRDVVGLYLNPPAHALVLSVDEKSQIQALDRTQPMLPLRPGQVERHTHDYVRHGVTSLFAALETRTGAVLGECFPRHRAIEFRKFLDRVDRTVPADLDIHLILDNASSHKTPPCPHAAVSPADQRQSRALHPDRVAPLGLQTPVLQLEHARRRAPGVPRFLQRRAAASVPRSCSTALPLPHAVSTTCLEPTPSARHDVASREAAPTSASDRDARRRMRRR